jgi:hypothetical protein
VATLSKEVRALEAECKGTEAKMSIADLEAANKRLDSATAVLAGRLVALRAAGKRTVTQADFAAAEANLDRYKREWKKRKAMCMDMIDQLSEGAGKKPKVLASDIGIDTDEQCKMAITSLHSPAPKMPNQQIRVK